MSISEVAIKASYNAVLNTTKLVDVTMNKSLELATGTTESALELANKGQQTVTIT